MSPSEINFGDGEAFITIVGSGFTGVTTMVVFDGQFSVEPSVLEETRIVTFVPFEVALVAGRHSIDIVVTDAAGTRQIGPAYVTVVEEQGGGNSPPLLSYPEIWVAEWAGPGGTPVSFAVSATSSSGSPLPVTCSPAVGSLFPLGVTPVQCSATDPNGTTTGNFIVIVTDTTPPVLVTPREVVSAEALVSFTVTATDNRDGDVPVNCTPASGSTFPAGTTLVKCFAYDSYLNLGSASFNVVVTNGPPALTLPVYIASPREVVHYTVTATGDATIVCTPPSGSTFPLGITTVNCTATNAFGTATGSFTVEVYDDGTGDETPPVLTLIDIRVEATSPAGATVTYTATAFDDVDGAITPTCTPASGSTFPLGVTTVQCSATDAAGNTATDSFTVTVKDTTAPEIVAISANPNVLWPPNHQMVLVTVTATVIDSVDDAPVTRIISVKSNQPIEGTGDGDTAPDWNIVGPMQVELRSERASGKDRRYTITVESVDASGNTTTATVEVKVSQSRRRAV